MCKTGGPRCEYADELHKVRQKTKRSKKYLEATDYQREQIVKVAEGKWKSTCRAEVLAHAAQRERWQTKAAKLPRRKMEALRKEFPAPVVMGSEEAAAHTKQMAEEWDRFEKNASREVDSAIGLYKMHGYMEINGVLRKGEKGLDPTLDNTMEKIQERIACIDEAMASAGEAEEPRTLYRHHMVPPGWLPRDYAGKYFPVGERISDPAFLSTTEDAGYIAGHIFYRRPTEYVVYQILSKKGLSLQDDEQEWAGNIQSQEKERLLPRGTNLRVVGHKREKLEIPMDRTLLRNYFGRDLWNKKIPPKNVTVIMLMDEDLL